MRAFEFPKIRGEKRAFTICEKLAEKFPGSKFGTSIEDGKLVVLVLDDEIPEKKIRDVVDE